MPSSLVTVLRPFSVITIFCGSVSFNTVVMFLEPFGRPSGLPVQDISRLAIAAAVPMLPLLLTIFSFEELLIRIVKVLF